MKKFIRQFLAFSFASSAFLLTLSSSLYADVKLPEIFSNGMVLQQKQKVPVWGWADAGEKVSVSFNGQTKDAVTAADGKWSVKLDELTAGGPFELTIKGNNEIKLTDVLVGEVWICSGQSNMEWAVRNSNNGAEEVKNANYPKIRLFHVRRNFSTVPLNKLTAEWKVCSPENIPNFSAVGYFFGRELHQKLNVPIGLIGSSWGGTRVEPWTPEIGFTTVPVLKSITELLKFKNPNNPEHKELLRKTIASYRAWANEAEKNMGSGSFAKKAPDYPGELLPFPNNHQPTTLYNAMINPFVPFAAKGAIWYQGEANLGDGKMYTPKMEALINGWRTVFENPDLAFYFVQLAPFRYNMNNPHSLPIVWEAQSEVPQKVKNTGMAVINDIGNPKDIHPKNKQDVGHRLALLARNKTYGEKGIVCESPAFLGMKKDGSKLVLSFTSAKGLKSRDGKPLTNFEISGPDGNYVPATATISGETVVISSDKVADPVAMRFAWNNIAEPNLCNGEGLPASAFRAGEIPERGLLDSLVPEAKKYELLYSFDPTNSTMSSNNTVFNYRTNRAKEIVGKPKRVAYFLNLVNADGSSSYVFVSMDAFTDNLSQLGVPAMATKAIFQTKVKNLTVKSNVKGVENGTFAEGNIEFWGDNYSHENAAKIPGAVTGKFDFGDRRSPIRGAGYGSMQVHNFLKKQTVFAYNQWKAGKNCDLGIGNSPSGHPDWTFTRAGSKCKSGQMIVLVEVE